MEVLQPFAVTDSNLTYSNLSENDYAAWSSGTSYSLSDRVIIVSEHSIYESQSNSNLNNNPATDDGTNWLKVGATNKWKPFDQKIGDRASNLNSIVYRFDITNNYLRSVVLFGLSGLEVNVKVTDTNTSDIIFEETASLIDTSAIVDGYTYFFEPFTTVTEVLFMDIPPFYNTELEITITGGSGETVEVGQIVFGSHKRLGITLNGTSLGIDDYSIKERDQFGNYYIVPRTYSDKVDFEVKFPTSTARQIQSFLASLRATPAVYIGSRETAYGAIIYGFYRSFELDLEGKSLSQMTIQVEGLT